MKQITIVFFLLCMGLSTQTLAQTLAQTHTKLGERPAECTKTEGDDFQFTIDKTLVPETSQLFEYDRLKQVITASPYCFRVGTEISLHLENETIGYLGRAQINRLDLISSTELKKINTPYSKNAIQDFIKKNPANKYGVINIKVYEKVTESVVTKKYERLPTCFSTYVDWEAYRVTAEEGIKVVNNIISGKKNAHLWNGTFNCYKIGMRANIYLVEDSNPQDYGSIVPTELAVLHYTNLTQRHAKILGENLNDLKKRMALKKDIDGGYVTLVVFDYLKPKMDFINFRSEQNM